MIIRPFDYTDADYTAVAEIKRLIWPDHQRTAEEMRTFDSNWDKQYLLQRLVAEDEGNPVAIAQYNERAWSHVPGKYGFWIEVHPAHRRRGYGRALYQYIVEALSARDLLGLTTQTREDQPEGIGFLERRGYTVSLREPQSRLYLRAFDRARFGPLLERVRASGVAIVSLTELQARDPDWKRKWWVLDCALAIDVPSSEPVTPQSFEQFERWMSNPNLLAETYFIALDGDRYIGATGLHKFAADPTKLINDLTGVLREYRRRGIATALKVHALAAAQRYGADSIRTHNEEHNPMYILNLALGFQPEPAWLEYSKTFNGSGL
jgi:mycothiol synthase